ncbi:MULTISPECIES: vWA domain-containing protein [Nocardioides]|uniref:VWA domain-containing protein n=1 Tax=Nocardioides vastitatis TaxID=2568655 RepID=A0ABW0ZF75_9ACTN|nr:vWA domain-containing protein [Nocardioides sp.]THJ15100.1 VWA domain-containing protein [Nocardioides sp.]
MSPAAATGLVIARRVGIALVFWVVLLRPGIGEAETALRLSDVEVLVVVDQTRSMAALDHQGREPRIDGVKKDLAELADALPGARFGMLAFGAEARLVLPFTTDTNAFHAAVETFYLEGPQDGVGSRADRPVLELMEILGRAEEQDPDRRRVVVFVGDGEDTREGEDHSFSPIGELVDGGVVLGYGTTDGAVMPVSDDLSTGEGYIRDPETGGDAVSRADPEKLETIADQLGVPFEHRTASGGMGPIAASFEASLAEDGGSRPAQHELTWLFGLVLFGLVLLELRAGWRALWTSQQTLLAPVAKGTRR